MERRITLLYDKAYELIHLGEEDGMVYTDDFTRLNKEVYELINVLWDKQGKTIDEEARICLSLWRALVFACMLAWRIKRNE